MNLTIDQKAREVLDNLASNPRLNHFIDCQLPIPQTYRGTGPIKLIILGQDPTANNVKSRATITTVLNLDKPGNIYNYLSRICNRLDFDLENIYASNYLKNFFKDPPTQITEIDVFKEFAPYWFPLLREELAQFPQVPIIILGEPLLSAIVCGGASPCVRDYWGYKPDWKSGEKGTYCCLEPDKNILGHVVFPFPHQPSIGKQFYAERFGSYVTFVKQQLNVGV